MKEQDKKEILIEQIKNEDGNILDYEETYDSNIDNLYYCPKKGAFSHSIFFTSSHLVIGEDYKEYHSVEIDEKDKERYEGAYCGVTGTFIRETTEFDGTEYAKDVLELMDEIEQKADEIEDKYKGVEVTIRDYNDGCEGGMGIDVWIPIHLE